MLQQQGREKENITQQKRQKTTSMMKTNILHIMWCVDHTAYTTTTITIHDDTKQHTTTTNNRRTTLTFPTIVHGDTLSMHIGGLICVSILIFLSLMLSPCWGTTPSSRPLLGVEEMVLSSAIGVSSFATPLWGASSRALCESFPWPVSWRRGSIVSVF